MHRINRIINLLKSVTKCVLLKMASPHNGSSLLALPTCALKYRVPSGPQGLSIVIFHFDAIMTHICGIISLSQVPKFGDVQRCIPRNNGDYLTIPRN